jgi:LPS O-antigen subunit length determinant protein (WzzB/FepE family)
MTENNYRNPDYFQYEEEESIDIMEYILKLWKKRKMIIIWCVAGAIIGLIAGFSIPKTYSASVTLAPEVQGKSSSSLSSLASMAGINLNSANSVDAITAEMYPEIVASTPFIYELFNLPVQFTRKDSVINTTLLDYMKEYQRSPWWTPIVNAPMKALGWCLSLLQPKEEEGSGEGSLNPYNLPEKERKIVKALSEAIMVTVDKKTLKTNVSLEMQDPLVVTDVVNAVVVNLSEYVSEYRTSKARQDAENLLEICEQRKAEYYAAQQAYATYMDANKNVALQSALAERERLQQEMNLAYQVYSQVASNLEAARIAEQQAKPVVTIIKPAEVPYRKTAPSKAKMLVIFTFLAGCIAAAWVLFGEEYWAKLKESLTGQNEETAQAEV